MTPRRPLPGPGCFQWNTGAWFGAQAGCTAWLFVGAAVLAPRAPECALLWLVCAAVANGVGLRLWQLRTRIRPFPAILMSLTGYGLGGLFALGALHLLRPGLSIDRPPGVHLRDEPWTIPAFLVLLLFLLGQACLQEWSARRERQRSRGRTGAAANRS